MVPTGYGRNDDNYEPPVLAPVRTELNSAEKTARYKVKRRALVAHVERLNNAPLTSSNEKAKLQKQLADLDKDQEEQLKYSSNCHYPLEDKECTVHMSDFDSVKFDDMPDDEQPLTLIESSDIQNKAKENNGRDAAGYLMHGGFPYVPMTDEQHKEAKEKRKNREIIGDEGAHPFFSDSECSALVDGGVTKKLGGCVFPNKPTIDPCVHITKEQHKASMELIVGSALSKPIFPKLDDIPDEKPLLAQSSATKVLTKAIEREKVKKEYTANRVDILTRIGILNDRISADSTPRIVLSNDSEEEARLWRKLATLDKEYYASIEVESSQMWSEEDDEERNAIKKAVDDMVNDINSKRDMERLLININRGGGDSPVFEKLNNPVANAACEYMDTMDAEAFLHMTDEELKAEDSKEADEECERRKFLKVINDDESTEEDFIRTLVEYGQLYEKSRITRIFHKEFKERIQERIKKINVDVNVTQEGLDKFKNSKAQISPNEEDMLEMLNTVVDENLVIEEQSDITKDAIDVHPFSKKAQEERQREWEGFKWSDKPTEDKKDSSVSLNIIVEALKQLIDEEVYVDLAIKQRAEKLQELHNVIHASNVSVSSKEAVLWQNLFTKEKSKSDMLVEDNSHLREQLATYARQGKMQWTINDAITKVHKGVNTDVMILCHTSQADKLFKQLCDRVVDRLKEERPEDVKILDDIEKKTNIIYYTDGSCIRIVTDSGSFVLEAPK